MLCTHRHGGSVETTAGLDGLTKRTAFVPLSNINLKYLVPKHDIRKLYKEVRQILRSLNRH
jgi:hypothetical protein